MFYLTNVCLNYHVLYGNRQQQAWQQHPNQLLAGRGLPRVIAEYHDTRFAGEETPVPGDELCVHVRSA